MLRIRKTPNIVGEAVGIFPNDFNGIVPVGFVDAECPAGADAVRVQKNHDFADGFLFMPRAGDLGPSHLADPVHFLQAFRFLFDNIEHVAAEHVHESPGKMRANSFNETGAEIAFDAFQRVRAGGARTSWNFLRSDNVRKGSDQRERSTSKMFLLH